MARIHWPAVEAGFLTKARLLLRLLRAVVACLAEALQRPVEELVRVAAVRVYMVRNAGCYCLALRKMEAA